MVVLHPGHILGENFLAPLNLTVDQVSALAGVPGETMEALLREHQPVTPALAKRLGKVFRMKPEAWMAMQAAWDLERVEDPLDARPADLRGFVTGPRGAILLPASRPPPPPDTTFSPELAQAISQAAAILARFSN